MTIDEQAQRVLQALQAGQKSREQLRIELSATATALRRWLEHLRAAGLIECDGATNKAVWRICTGNTMPDESECQPFTHNWRGVGEWVHKHPARAVSFVFDLGAK